MIVHSTWAVAIKPQPTFVNPPEIVTIHWIHSVHQWIFVYVVAEKLSWFARQMNETQTHTQIFVCTIFFLDFHVMRRLIGTCGEKRFYTQPTMEPFRYSLYICYTSTNSLLAYPLSGSSAGGVNICFVTKEKQINGSFSTFAVKRANWTFQPRFIKSKKITTCILQKCDFISSALQIFFSDTIISLALLHFDFNLFKSYSVCLVFHWDS